MSTTTVAERGLRDTSSNGESDRRGTTRRIAFESLPTSARPALPVRSRRRLLRALLIGLDILVVGASLAGAWWMVTPEPVASIDPRLGMLVLPSLIASWMVGGYRVDQLAHGLSLKVLMVLPLMVLALAFVAADLLVMALGEGRFSAQSMLVALTAVGLYGCWVAASRWPLRRMWWRYEVGCRILCLGGGASPPPLESYLRQQKVANRFRHIPLVERSEGLEYEGDGSLTAELEGRVRAILLMVPFDLLSRRVQEDLVHARVRNIPVCSPAQFIEEALQKVVIDQTEPGWFLHAHRMNGFQGACNAGMKRLMDVVVATTLLILLSPVLLLTAIAIKVTSPGPALFKQQRTGRYDQTFTILKFRSMCVDAEKDGAQWAKANDCRVTPLGQFLRKSRIDELPQLVNIIRGDMSLVGPRPERPEFNKKLVHALPYYDLRHLVRPGVTGWAQVKYPYGASVEDALAKLEYDIYYVRHASLFFDLRIIVRTLAVIIGMRGR